MLAHIYKQTSRTKSCHLFVKFNRKYKMSAKTSCCLIIMAKL